MCALSKYGGGGVHSLMGTAGLAGGRRRKGLAEGMTKIPRSSALLGVVLRYGCFFSCFLAPGLVCAHPASVRFTKALSKYRELAHGAESQSPAFIRRLPPKIPATIFPFCLPGAKSQLKKRGMAGYKPPSVPCLTTPRRALWTRLPPIPTHQTSTAAPSTIINNWTWWHEGSFPS